MATCLSGRSPGWILSLTWILSLPVGALSEVDAVITTELGTLRLHIFEEDKPKTVANFLRYVREDRYHDSFFHRWIPGFIIQAGGFKVDGRDGAEPAFGIVDGLPPIANEFAVGPKLENRIGTVAMAKVSGDPDSATSEWFLNLADNQDNLDNQNGGFTVFGQISDDSDFLGKINQIDQENGPFLLNLSGTPFTDLPVLTRDNPGFGDLIYFDVRIERPAGIVSLALQQDQLAIRLTEAVPSQSYILEFSDDFHSWESGPSVVADAAGNARLHLSPPADSPRFFRMRAATR